MKKKFCKILKEKLDKETVYLGDIVYFWNNKWKVIGLYDFRRDVPITQVDLEAKDRNENIHIDVSKLKHYNKWCKYKGQLKHQSFSMGTYAVKKEEHDE